MLHTSPRDGTPYITPTGPTLARWPGPTSSSDGSSRRCAEQARSISTLVVVTSDHGEALGEHGEDVHGYFVYESTLRVPLVLRGPGVTPGTRFTGVARTVDLFPTIVEIAGLAARPAIVGAQPRAGVARRRGER